MCQVNLVLGFVLLAKKGSWFGMRAGLAVEDLEKPSEVLGLGVAGD